MKSDRYVRSCVSCQKTKPEHKLPVGHMGKLLIPNKPWQIISRDFIGPAPKSSHGHQYVFVVTDNFTKFSIFFPLRRALASDVVKILEENVFLLFGVPQFLRCDNGVQFKGKELEKLCKKFNFKIIFTLYYHPQPNSVERVNQVLKSMIRAYVSSDHKKWDEYLSALACGIQTARHEVTENTPLLASN